MNASPADHDFSSRPSSQASDNPAASDPELPEGAEPELTEGAELEEFEDWDDLVDHASWPRFETSLERLLADSSRPAFVVLLTAPAPVVRSEHLPRRRGLAGMFRRSTAQASPEVPGLILAVGGTSAQVAVQVQDARERFLLDGEQIATLHMLGWEMDEDVMTRAFTPSEEAASAVTSILLDVLRVPHPADTDYLFKQQA